MFARYHYTYTSYFFSYPKIIETLHLPNRNFLFENKNKLSCIIKSL